jgi:uncharacterized protein (DUF3084 family)
MPKKSHRSGLQKAQSARNLDHICSTGKEDVPPIASVLIDSELAKALHHTKLEKLRGDDYKRKNHNEHQKKLRSEAQVQKLKSHCTVISEEAAKSEAQLKLVTHERDTFAAKNSALLEKNGVLRTQKDTLRKAQE